MDAPALDAVYETLLATYGAQQWWPIDGPKRDARLEMCAGAILVQHTSWRGAERALKQLRAAGALSIEAFATLPEQQLGELLRGAGTYRTKARRLRSFAEAVLAEGSLVAFLDGAAEEVRERCLAVWGVGPETADVITLYAARRPSFVVDAYAQRLLERLELAPEGVRGYEGWRTALLAAVGDELERLGEWHALIVVHGKERCRARAPRCEGCPLLERCPEGQRRTGAAASGAE